MIKFHIQLNKTFMILLKISLNKIREIKHTPATNTLMTKCILFPPYKYFNKIAQNQRKCNNTCTNR